ncbi:hypothetical protein SELMODRAFT_423491 [Selaginella moellendorffii]|uniref:Uncharacterized protein n=1 Tax=Selaginella moellendorffii TaxID=88036 RepID=D8SLW0_SELML|nr:hypothetical protein SELMODRAFT_423491 [Selaginella moellendorffii]
MALALKWLAFLVLLIFVIAENGNVVLGSRDFTGIVLPVGSSISDGSLFLFRRLLRKVQVPMLWEPVERGGLEHGALSFREIRRPKLGDSDLSPGKILASFTLLIHQEKTIQFHEEIMEGDGDDMPMPMPSLKGGHDAKAEWPSGPGTSISGPNVTNKYGP